MKNKETRGKKAHVCAGPLLEVFKRCLQKPSDCAERLCRNLQVLNMDVLQPPVH